MTSHPGASPEMQGRLAFCGGYDRVPPDWHQGHDIEFIRRWLDGYDRELEQDKIRNE